MATNIDPVIATLEAAVVTAQATVADLKNQLAAAQATAGTVTDQQAAKLQALAAAVAGLGK